MGKQAVEALKPPTAPERTGNAKLPSRLSFVRGSKAKRSLKESFVAAKPGDAGLPASHAKPASPAKPTKPKNNDTAIALEVAAICEAIKTFGPGDAFVKELQAAAASRLAAAA